MRYPISPQISVIPTLPGPILSYPQWIDRQHAHICRSSICKTMRDVGVARRAVLFSSGQTSKKWVLFYCCNTEESKHRLTQDLYLFLCQLLFLLSFSSSISFVLAPSEVRLSLRQHSFEPILSFPYRTRNIWSGVWTASLSVISQVSQPACTWTDRTMKAENRRTMWDQMFLLRFAV